MNGPRSPRALIEGGAARLRSAGLASPVADAEWLLAGVLDSRPTALYASDDPVPDALAGRYLAQVESRAAGTPLQHLLGYEEFYGARFAVRPGVFIPRPETEVVVGKALEVFSRLGGAGGAGLRLADAGVGSGCIAVTLARLLPACVVVGIELLWEPLWAARDNAGRLGVLNRVHLVRGQWLKPLRPWVDGIVSNPPYVPSAQVDFLPLDVRREPRESLDGGPDGLRDAGEVITQAERVLRPGGSLVLECGEDQVAPLVRLASGLAWVSRADGFDDLTRRPRGLVVTRRAG